MVNRRRRIVVGRCLVVDDEPTVRDTVRMLLEFDGHHVSTASSGEEALAIFEQGKFDLVFTDFAMPGMNGHELATVLKARAPRLPIIMISAHADAFLTNEPPPNVDLLLSKPFRFEDLRNAVAGFLP